VTRFQRFLYNAVLLTFSSLGLRAVGVLFNRYLTARLGAAGLGQFSLILSVYGFAVTVAASGIHLAVTRVVSESIGTGRCGDLRQAVRTGLCYSGSFGLFSAVLLYLLAPVIAVYWLGDAQTAASLRMLALSLPFLSLSTTMNGYFVGVRQAYKGAVTGVLGQAAKIGATVLLLRGGTAYGVSPTAALVLGNVLSEILCFLLSLVLFLPDCLRRCRSCAAADGESSPKNSVTRYLLRIALPIALTACIRSGLQTLQHLLIPLGLERWGADSETALAAYGTVHGMVLPVLLFPAAFLSAFSGLLIPEVAEFRSRGDTAAIRRTAVRVLRVTLCFAIPVSGIMLCYSDLLGQLLYKSADAGRYLRLLGALIPIMYLDTMVDAMLKGLDEQLASMRYNLLDAAFCVVMAYLFLPAFGITGYLMLLYTSELFNLALSLGKLLAVTRIPVHPLRWAAKPILAVIGACCITLSFFRLVNPAYRYPAAELAAHITAVFFVYTVLLFLLGGYGLRELYALRRLLLPHPQTGLAKSWKVWYNIGKSQSKGHISHDKRHQIQQGRPPRHL